MDRNITTKAARLPTSSHSPCGSAGRNRRYLPALAKLPDKLIHAPWQARPVDLAAAGVRLGVDYPEPIVDHAEARARTLARFEAVRQASD